MEDGIVYKAVAKKDGKFFSLLDMADERVSVEYIIGEASRPKIVGSPLFCYSEIPEMHESFFEEGTILVCEKGKEFDQKVRLSSTIVCYDQNAFEVISEFWSYVPRAKDPRSFAFKHRVSEFSDIIDIGSKVVLVESLKPIRELTKEEYDGRNN
jgi:hypothetical protein